MTDPAGASGAPQYSVQAKVIISVVLALAMAAFVLAFLTVNTDSDPQIVGGAPGEASSARGVEALVPGEGDQALARQPVGIDLAAGWTAELTLLPATGAAIPLPLDQVETNSLNQFLFRPGEGRAVDRLPTGENCIRALIWDQAAGRDASERLEQWCFDVL